LELNLEKKKAFFAYRTTRSTFGPPAEAGPLPPARLPPLSPVRRARRTQPRRSRAPRDRHAPAPTSTWTSGGPYTPRARLHPQCHVCLPLLHRICLPSLSHCSKQPSGSLRHRRAPPRRSWSFRLPQLTARASIFLRAPPSRPAARARLGSQWYCP
jgi:hypothetical protein